METKKEIKVIRPSGVELITGDKGWSVKPLISRKYANSDNMWIAWVEFEPKGSHDWHVHEDHDEALIVINGEITFSYTKNGQTIKEILNEGDAAFVPMGMEHKWENGEQPLTAIVGKTPSPPGAGR